MYRRKCTLSSVYVFVCQPHSCDDGVVLEYSLIFFFQYSHVSFFAATRTHIWHFYDAILICLFTFILCVNYTARCRCFFLYLHLSVFSLLDCFSFQLIPVHSSIFVFVSYNYLLFVVFILSFSFIYFVGEKGNFLFHPIRWIIFRRGPTQSAAIENMRWCTRSELMCYGFLLFVCVSFCFICALFYILLFVIV